MHWNKWSFVHNYSQWLEKHIHVHPLWKCLHNPNPTRSLKEILCRKVILVFSFNVLSSCIARRYLLQGKPLYGWTDFFVKSSPQSHRRPESEFLHCTHESDNAQPYDLETAAVSAMHKKETPNHWREITDNETANMAWRGMQQTPLNHWRGQTVSFEEPVCPLKWFKVFVAWHNMPYLVYFVPLKKQI